MTFAGSSDIGSVSTGIADYRRPCGPSACHRGGAVERRRCDTEWTELLTDRIRGAESLTAAELARPHHRRDRDDRTRWQTAHPAEILTRLYADEPALAHIGIDFGRTFTRLLTALCLRMTTANGTRASRWAGQFVANATRFYGSETARSPM
jgi:hypothetical protein